MQKVKPLPISLAYSKRQLNMECECSHSRWSHRRGWCDVMVEVVGKYGGSWEKHCDCKEFRRKHELE